jgi:hypothetical protein
MSDATQNDYYKEMNKYYKFQMEKNVNEAAVFALNNVKFTAITIHTTIQGIEVIFVGTNDGRVIELMTRQIQSSHLSQAHQKQYTQPIVIREYQVFDKNIIVNSLVVGTTSNTNLLVISNEQIKTIQLDKDCDKYKKSCNECIASQDPYCAWSKSENDCLPLNSLNQKVRFDFMFNLEFDKTLTGSTN